MIRWTTVTLLALAVMATGATVPGAEVPAPKSGEAPEGREIAWRLSGPGGGGWIQSMAFDPTDKDVLYVGCDVGGFYFSENAGRSYEIRNTGLHDYFIESIAVHPADHNILLLGTESGIHRTTDRGLHWQWLRDGFPKPEQHRFSAPIGAICFDPQKPTIAYAGTGRPRWGPGKPGAVDGAAVLYRSEDAGQTWKPLDTNPIPPRTIVSHIAVQPGESKTILLATTAGVFRSDDGGARWQRSDEGIPHPHVEELAFAPSAPRTVYATLRCTAGKGEAPNGGVYRSDDAGRTWHAANGQGLPRAVINRPGDSLNLSSNPKEIAVDPRDANIVYVGHRDWVTAGLYKTIDGGAHWSPVARRSAKEPGIADYGWITMWGPSVQCLALSPAAPDRVAFGTSGHIFLSDDAGRTWQQRYSRPDVADGRIAGSGLEVTCVWRIAADPVRPRRVYVCFMDIGLLISDDDGRTFRRSARGMKMGENCFGVVVDPRSPKTLWAATGWWGHNDGDVCRSDDDGVAWRVIGDAKSGLPAGQVLEMALDASSPAGQRRLLAISKGNGLFETPDGGLTWRAIGGDLPAEAKKNLTGLLLDPADPKHILVSSRRDVFQTADGGATWLRLNPADQQFSVTRLVPDPHRFSTLYLTSRRDYDQQQRRAIPGGLFRSDDGGRTWRQILDDRYAADIAVSPADRDVLYVAAKDDPYHDDALAAGVLKSADGGRTWKRENGGMSHRNIKTLCISPHDPATIYAGSTGNGAFIGRDTGAGRPRR